VRQFDPKRYLADVLAPAYGSPELPSLYERYLLDLDDADEAAIAARLDEVKRYWDKKAEHPRYGPMIRAFRDQHAEAKLTLGDAQERARVGEEARAREQAAAEARRGEIERWERMLQEVVTAGGLDPARRAQLEKLAGRAGIPDDVARAKLDAAPQVAEPVVLDPGVRSDIAGKLTALAQSVGEPRLGLSLFHALGLGIADDVAEVKARRAAKVAEMNSIGGTNIKEVWDRVLSLVKLHLIDADPSAYVNGLAADVREALEADAFSAVADRVVDEVEAAQLQGKAVELGLTPELAQQVIAELARENGAVVRSGGAVDFVACPNCNHPHPREAGDEHCRECGTALFVLCPADCGHRNDATSGRCSKCGADLHRHAEASRSLQRLAGLLDEGRVGQAEVDLALVRQVLGPAGAGVAEAAREVTAAVESTKRRWAAVEAARKDRCQYAARQRLGDLFATAKDMPGPNGELPADALSAVEVVIAEAEKLFDASHGLAAEQHEQALVDVLRIAADHAGAERELDRLPPEPPAAVDAVASGTGMVVRWGASTTGGVTYAVTRINAQTGIESRVGDADELRIEDPSAPAGAVVRYAVTAVRGRASSAAARSEPALVAPEVARLAAVGGDNEVRLSWTPLGGAGRVVVERREESAAAAVVISPDGAGATDRSVVNGTRYTYAVAVEYAGPEGQLVRTPGQTVFAEPVARPQPLQGLEIQPGPAGVRIGFEPPPAGTVVVVKCAADPELTPGSELELGRLGEIGEQLVVDGAAATDPQPPAGPCFYLPVTVAGSLAIAGVAARHVSLPEMTGARAVANGRKVLVTWSWPEQIRLARVVWRHDRQPSGPDDPMAACLDLGRGEYRDAGGCSIESGDQRSIFVTVFSAIRADGEVVFGSAAGKGARATLRRESKTEVRYSVRRVGRLLAKRLEIEVCEPADGALPGLVLVGREGDILPRSANDGTVLARLGGDGPRSSTVDLRELSRPLTVRMFLDSASAAGSHVLFDPMADDLLVS
jgi:hypothetical protein